MINTRKFHQLKTNEHLPVIILAILIISVIHLCNKHDERTANQYILEDEEKGNSRLCPLYPSSLQGNSLLDMSSDLKWTDIEQRVKNVQAGGIYSPSDCTSRQQLAVIIPFRNREYPLKVLLRHLHPFLQRQKRSYQVFVVEQFGNGTFNKGLIMNVAFHQASKQSTSAFDCFVFHDVDMIPENDYNVYECDRHGPRHLSPAVDELRYFLMYNDLIGGALAVTKEQFIRANGWSNLYWGWGFEDDDMNHRLRHAGYRISRPPNLVGRYKMVRHEKQTPSTNRYGTLSKWLRYSYDGIRQLNSLDYSIATIETRSLYTHILVNFTRLATKTIDHLLTDLYCPKYKRRKDVFQSIEQFMYNDYSNLSCLQSEIPITVQTNGNNQFLNMIKKRLIIPVVLLHLLLQLTLTFISSLHWFLLVLSLIGYVILLFKEYYHPNNPVYFCNHYLSTIIFTIIHFIFVLSYNKILPWEIGLVILFGLLILHYARRQGLSILRWDLTWLPLGHQQENNSIASIVIVKFLVSSLLFFGYTCQLCLTTVCTPSLYLNWFLVISDCRYVYSFLLSSYTFAGGILILLTWTIVSILHLIVHKFKS